MARRAARARIPEREPKVVQWARRAAPRAYRSAQHEGSPVSAFPASDGELHAEGVPLAAIAERSGRPATSTRAPRSKRASARSTPPSPGSRISSATRSRRTPISPCSNVLARLGSGFDIVSGGELARVIAAGGDPGEDRVLRRRQDRGRDGGRAGGGHPLLQRRVGRPSSTRSNAVAGRAGSDRAGLAAGEPGRRPGPTRTSRPGSRRASSASPSRTRPRSTGARRGLPHIAVRGIDCHIGSQITDLSAFVEAAAKMFDLVDRLAARRDRARAHRPGRRARHPLPRRGADRSAGLRARGAAQALGARRHELRLRARPASSSATPACCSTRVDVPQARREPRLRDRRRGDERPPPPRAVRRLARRSSRCARAPDPRAAGRSSGPVCESGDFLARDRELALAAGDLLAVRRAGAYGFVDELQLQLAPARQRGRRRRRPRASRPSARDAPPIFSRTNRMLP